MQLEALALGLQAARGVTTAAPSRQEGDEVPGFELKTGPPGSVRPGSTLGARTGFVWDSCACAQGVATACHKVSNMACGRMPFFVAMLASPLDAQLVLSTTH